MVDNLHSFFIHPGEAFTRFFYYCTISAVALENRHGTLALSTLSGLQSLVYDPVQPQDCKHWYFEGEEPKSSLEYGK